MLLVVILVISVNALSVHSRQDVLKWNRLRVTFWKFSGLPLTEQEAQQKGWNLITDDCKGSSPFKGRRYMLDNDHATIPIYDVNGNVAGLQMAYKADQQKSPINSPGYVKMGGKVYITAYFTSPANICNGASRRQVGDVGDKLMLMVGRDKYMNIPLSEEKIKQRPMWKSGQCFRGMGQHYWYGISNEMNCADAFPFFLLYNKGVLQGWGFVAMANIKSPRVEHPPAQYLKYFFKKETMPRCMLKVKRTTQHVYFTDVTPSSHVCR